MQETRIKGYILIVGYRVTVDENVNPGRYGFRIDHDHDQTHYFSSEERGAIRDWMKAIMKATILRDFSCMRFVWGLFKFSFLIFFKIKF